MSFDVRRIFFLGPVTMHLDSQSVANDDVTECDDDSIRGSDAEVSYMEDNEPAPPSEVISLA